MRICALCIGQVVNDRGRGRDASVSLATAKGWLSLLEDGFLIKLLSPTSLSAPHAHSDLKREALLIPDGDNAPLS